MNKKSILAETLSEIQGLKEDIQKNANHVLRSTLKEDLEEIVRKGLKEVEDDMESEDMGDDEPMDSDAGIGDDMDDEMPSDIDTDEFADDSEIIDLTDKPFDEVSDTFETLKLSDEVSITRNEDGSLQINIQSGDVGGMPSDLDDEEEDMAGMDMGGEMGMDDEEDTMDLDMGDEEDVDGLDMDDEDELREDNPIYEIDFSDEDEMEESKSSFGHDKHSKKPFGKGKKGSDKEDDEDDEKMNESTRFYRRKLSEVMLENKKYKSELRKVKGLVTEFKKSEKDYKSAIGNLKSQLQEVALFTSNLTYAIKLMTENSTTKDEKLDILKKFDSVKTLNESRQVYNNLETLFKSNNNKSNKTIEERVVPKPKASGATKINESTVYKNPQLDRMLDIIHKLK